MSIILRGHAPTREYRWVLRAGQQARVGRSPWADFCIADDDRLRDMHVQLAVDRHGLATVTAVDNAEIVVDHDWTESIHGREDLRILAGQTRLVLSRERRLESSKLGDRAEATQSLISSAMKDEAALASAAVLEQIGLSSAAIELLTGVHSAQEAVQLLVEQELEEDALRCLIVSLPAHTRLRWCSQILEQAGYTLDSEVASMVELWLREPAETQRQLIAAQVNWNQKHDPRTWLMASIGWTGGSLAGPSSVPVPPTDQMVCTGVVTAINLAGARGDIKQFHRQAIQLGLQRVTSSKLCLGEVGARV